MPEAGPAPQDLATALRSLGGAGPFFILEGPGPGDPPGGWRPVGALVADEALLRGRVEAGRALLARLAGLAPGEVEQRVAASVVVLGVAARLSAPVLGLAALHGMVPQPDGLRWRDAGPGPVALRLDPGTSWAATGGAPRLADALQEQLVEPLLVPLARTARRVAPLARALLLGNVASGLAGAAAVLARHDAEAGGRAHDLVDRLLARHPLRGAGGASRGFRRSTCCLYYRLPGGGTCGDCPLPAGTALAPGRSSG
ncbi:(2Fe-2S)-binding protein [Vallicoccus soli]|uniref:(2Fe-2S)-binding protein n=1 Tax=Vallicoccus soli TaxID=2339232 RepID=A0A3A3Z968_9ACTN|nr:(2Fe-2S)-binding protein [Vallicoccus soli]RJK97616.1 (2Fe-2S)-binding protein [Vallicoccus soli]